MSGIIHLHLLNLALIHISKQKGQNQLYELACHNLGLPKTFPISIAAKFIAWRHVPRPVELAATAISGAGILLLMKWGC